MSALLGWTALTLWCLFALGLLARPARPTDEPDPFDYDDAGYDGEEVCDGC